MNPVSKYINWSFIAPGAQSQIYHGLNTAEVMVACYYQNEEVLDYSMRVEGPLSIWVKANKTPIEKVLVMG